MKEVFAGSSFQMNLYSAMFKPEVKSKKNLNRTRSIESVFSGLPKELTQSQRKAGHESEHLNSS